jgi:serine/threonine protein kinase
MRGFASDSHSCLVRFAGLSKTLEERKARQRGLMLRFDRERRLLAKTHHTHIVPLYTTGRQRGLLYFAMQYIDGASLGDVIRTARSHASNGGFPSGSSFETLVREAYSSPGRDDGEAVNPASRPVTHPLPLPCIRSAVQVVISVAEALHHAHGLGIVHRDVKPSNIMVEPNSHAWVLDFGLARFKGEGDPVRPVGAKVVSEPDQSQSRTRGFIGTPLYASPEQHQDSSAVDPRCDVWSLGVSLYELLTLRRPFRNVEEVCGERPIRGPRGVDARIPADLDAVVLKALRRNPDDRYPSTLAFADDLRRWLEGRPVSARPAKALRRAWMWSKRNRLAASSLMVATVALVALALSGNLRAVGETFRREKAEDALRADTRHQLLNESLRIANSSQHAMGWRRTLNGNLGQLARLGADHVELRPLAVAMMSGLDAIREKESHFPALEVAFDPTGQRLYSMDLKGTIRVYDRQADKSELLTTRAHGTFAFRLSRATQVL